MAKDITKPAGKSGRTSASKSSGTSPRKRSSKRSSKRAGKTEQSSSTSTESAKVSRPLGKAARRIAAASDEQTVRLRLRGSVSRGGRTFGPGEADVPASLAESLKLNGAEEV